MVKIMSFHCSFEMYSVGDVAEGDGQGVLCSRSGRGETTLAELDTDTIRCD